MLLEFVVSRVIFRSLLIALPLFLGACDRQSAPKEQAEPAATGKAAKQGFGLVITVQNDLSRSSRLKEKRAGDNQGSACGAEQGLHCALGSRLTTCSLGIALPRSCQSGAIELD
jgi:hypothetical protein